MRFDAKARPVDRQQTFLAGDGMLNSLRDMSPDELDAWLAANANNFPQVRALLKRLTVAVTALLNERTAG